MRFALIVAVAAVCLCLVAGGFARHLTRQRVAADSLGALADLAGAIENTVTIGASARDDVLLGEAIASKEALTLAGLMVGQGLIIALLLYLVATRLVQSSPGAGSRFTISLSLPRALVPHRRLVDVRPLSGQGALIVDDNRASRAMLRELLETCGMHVTEAADAGAALGLLGAGMPGLPQPFQLAIIDLQMPGMDGLQLAQSMRALPCAARLPLLLLTSPIAVVDQARLRQLDIRQHLDKPVHREELLATLCTMLGIESRLPAALGRWLPAVGEATPPAATRAVIPAQLARVEGAEDGATATQRLKRLIA